MQIINSSSQIIRLNSRKIYFTTVIATHLYIHQIIYTVACKLYSYIVSYINLHSYHEFC